MQGNKIKTCFWSIRIHKRLLSQGPVNQKNSIVQTISQIFQIELFYNKNTIKDPEPLQVSPWLAYGRADIRWHQEILLTP